MRKSIINLEVDDVFNLMHESKSRLFSSISLAVDKSSENPIGLLCSSLYNELAKNQYKIQKDGHMIMRVITPVISEITLAETYTIMGKIQEYNPGNIVFGVESTDATTQLTIDLIFETYGC